MKRKAVDKNFDDAAVQAIPDLGAMWSDEARMNGKPADVHPEVAARIDSEVRTPCSTSAAAPARPEGCSSIAVDGLDISIEQLKQLDGPRAIGNALHLPFADAAFDAAASLYTLYFFEEPGAVVEEALRVLRPGGPFVTCAPSRHDSPEINRLARRDDFEAFASEDIEERWTGVARARARVDIGTRRA